MTIGPPAGELRGVRGVWRAPHFTRLIEPEYNNASLTWQQLRGKGRKISVARLAVKSASGRSAV